MQKTLAKPFSRATLWAYFNQAFNVLTQPKLLFDELSQTHNLGPAWISLAITSLLFSISSLVSHYHQLPYTADPLWPLVNYRIYQALAMPLILFLGWWLGTGVVFYLRIIFRVEATFTQLLAIIAPALFVPLWVMMWPTDMAVALGVLDPSMPGFVGLWIHHLMPSLTTFYIMGLLWFALWNSLRVLLREAFSLAVLSLLAVLVFWAAVLR